MTTDPKPLTREEVERILRNGAGIMDNAVGGEDSIAALAALGTRTLDLARTCLALIDERDEARASEATTRALLALARQDEDTGSLAWATFRLQQPGSIEAMDHLDRLFGDDNPHGNTMLARVRQATERIAHLEAVLAVEQGRHVPGVTDGWEWDGWRWRTDDCDTDAQRTATGKWLVSQWSEATKCFEVVGNYDTAHAAITAANEAAKAAEEEG